MRYDTPIFFESVKPGAYDSETGDYIKDTVTYDMVYANITDSGVQTLNLVYGELKQGCYTIRLQNIYRKPFDYIKIYDKHYRVDYSRKLRTKQIFVVSEVQ